MAIFDEVASRGYVVSMRTVGLKTLKNKLSEYVRLAASGEAGRDHQPQPQYRRDRAATKGLEQTFSSAGSARGVADASDRSGHRAPAAPSDGTL